MALPFSPDPSETTRQERRLVDRAHFLGDAARTGRKVEGSNPEEDFEKLLQRRMESGEEAEEAPEVMGDLPQPAVGEWTPGEIDAHNREQTFKEAEKRGGWTGPTLLMGLPVLLGGPPVPAMPVEGSRQSREERETERGDEIRPGEARVDADVLAGLREAGLLKPLTGLDDPRLAGLPRLPAEDGWRQGPTATGVTCLWESAGAHQRLEWSEGSTLLESAAGTSVQVLERNGSRLSSRLSRRELPRRRVFRVDET
ncbi:MAG: hypothetical protein HY319_21695 [Armatimonadetes bacterium]|nr:hypothetical protein [Armatimonadota bacterium]